MDDEKIFEDEDEKEEEVLILSESINPLCRKCSERVDTSITTRKDILCMYGLKPLEATKPTEMTAGTIYKCKKFSPIDDLF